MSLETLSQTLSPLEIVESVPIRVRYTNYENLVDEPGDTIDKSMKSLQSSADLSDRAIVSGNVAVSTLSSRSSQITLPVGIKTTQESLEEQIRTHTSSMEWQLIALYSERERLEQELGVSEAEQVIALVRELRQRPEPVSSAYLISNPLTLEPVSPDATTQDEPVLSVVSARPAPSPTAHSPLRVEVRALYEQLGEIYRNLEDQLLSVYGERKRLEREIGSGETAEVVAIVRGLRQKQTALLRELNRLPLTEGGSRENLHDTAGLANESALKEDQRMSVKIREAQIASHPLYLELERSVATLITERNDEIECFSLDEAIEVDALLRSLQERLTVTRDTEAHLVTLYAERETLAEQLQTADSGEIIALVRTLETEVRDLTRQKERNRTQFIPREVFSSLPHLTRSEQDALDFAVIGLDDSGMVLSVNLEAMRSIRLTVAEIVGANLFTRVLPCLNNRLVYGHFREGIATGFLDEGMTYTLTYKVKPTNVLLHLYRDPATQTNWLLMKAKG